MRSSDAVRSDIRILQEKLSVLRLELAAAELAECQIPFKIGQRIQHRGHEYEIGHIAPWGTDNAWLKGFKIKKDGSPSSTLVSIASASTLMSAIQ